MFAFGSNILAEKMLARGVNVIQAQPAKLAGWKLNFNLMGFPPVEPSFANIGQGSSEDSVHGVLYTMEPTQFEVRPDGVTCALCADQPLLRVAPQN